MKSRIVFLANGFTLLEVLIVIALLSIAAGATLIIGTDSIGRATAARERDLVASLLHTARAEALANLDETNHGVHVGADAYVLFSGTTYDAGAASNKPFPKEDAVTVTGSTDIVFTVLSGDVEAGGGTLTFTDQSGTATLSINERGGIEW